jgi:hypothetical protein
MNNLLAKDIALCVKETDKKLRCIKFLSYELADAYHDNYYKVKCKNINMRSTMIPVYRILPDFIQRWYLKYMFNTICYSNLMKYKVTLDTTM